MELSTGTSKMPQKREGVCVGGVLCVGGVVGEGGWGGGGERGGGGGGREEGRS